MTRTVWVAALIFCATGAYAEGTWTFGLIGGGTKGVYVGEDDYTYGAVPMLSYDTERLHIGLDGVSYEAFDYGIGTVSLSLGYRGAPDFPDKDLFKGLKRDGAVEAGIGTMLNFGDAYLGLDVSKDITDAHKGTEATATIGYVLDAGAFQVDMAIGAKYRDAKLNQYLYGVTAAEATSVRAAYTAEKTTTGFASLTVGYPITDSVTLIGSVDYEDLGKSADSPLVKEQHPVSFGLGAIMRF